MNFDEQTYETIEAYLDNTLSEAERLSFEKRMQDDPNLAIEIRINREMRAQFSKASNATISNPEYDSETLASLEKHLKSEEISQLSKKIKEGKRLYDKTSTSKKPILRYLYYAAAAVALIFLVNRFFITPTNTSEELYVAYSDWKNLPSLTSKGADQNNLAKGETLFAEKKYKEAITIFSKNEYINNPHVLMYLGVSYLESNNFEKAQITFHRLLNGKTLESNKAYWYITLTYLKQGNNEKAIEYLQLLRTNKNNYQYKEAGELLSKIREK